MGSQSDVELLVLARLMSGDVQAPSYFRDVQRSVFTALIAKNFIREASDDHGGYQGYQITDDGRQALADHVSSGQHSTEISQSS